MGLVFGILTPILLLLLIVLLAGGVYGLMRGRLTLASIVHAYCAVVLGICLVLALAGAALIVKSIAAASIGLDFSYQTADYPRPKGPVGTVEPAGPTANDRATAQARDDLASGIALLVIGGGLGTLHAFARAVAARRDGVYATAISRGFDVALLLVGAAVGLASSAFLLDAILRLYLFAGPPTDPYNAPHPGGALGFAVAFLPLWLVFARRVWRSLNAAVPTVHAAPTHGEIAT